MKAYLRMNRYLIIGVCCGAASFVVVFLLYGLPLEAVAYAGAITVFCFLVIGGFRYAAFAKKHRELLRLRENEAFDVDVLPETESLIEEDYQGLIAALEENRRRLALETDRLRTDAADYYSLWAHQIKTPIAAIKLLLQAEEEAARIRSAEESGGMNRPGKGSEGKSSEESAAEKSSAGETSNKAQEEPHGDDSGDGSEDENEFLREVARQLFNIELYVDMALGYQRSESPSSDLIVANYSLDEIVKQAVRKLSKMFIQGKIKLELADGLGTALTDEKWLEFVIEQLLTNSLKYAPGGTVSIYMENAETLVVRDDGIGIAAEDLPRVFEKGYTGFNGRIGQKSTGIGLYLCKKTLDRLSHTIALESSPGNGTTVRIGFHVTKL